MNISIIGAGLAGLSCGIHLLNKGFRVTIHEKNDRPGGRANLVEENGFKIDMGPTLVLMPEVLQNTFTAVGKDIKDYLTLQHIQPGYRIRFADGRTFDITDDLQSMVRQVKTFAPDKEEAFFEYLKDVQDKFVYSKGSFIERNFESVVDIVSLRSLKCFFKIKPFGNAYAHVRRYFQNDYLAMVFSLQCLYLGQSPLKTPALYNLLAYIEFTYGIWYPKGGMNQIPQALTRLFREMGGVLQTNSEATSLVIENKTAKGIRLNDGTIELSDIVVSNRDLPASYQSFVDEKDRPSVSDRKIKSWNYGCSAVLFYLGVRRKLGGFLHHNIVLSQDYLKSCREIFDEGVLPDDPILYIACPSKTDDSLAPEGKDVIYILALVPNLNSKVDWPRELPDFRKRVIRRIQESGLDLKENDIELERTFQPRDFESRYGNFYGNAFGLAPDFLQSACFRPMTKSRSVKNFYHTGASTHPGGGIPMVLTSGRLVAEQIQQTGKR